jgi:general secretion pathway protein A
LPFSKAAMRRIHALARGVPRRINLLADRAMLGAYAESAPRVDERIVDKAASEVFGTERRRSLLRKVMPWALGSAAGAAIAGTVAVIAMQWTREPSAAPASKTASQAGQPAAVPASSVGPSASASGSVGTAGATPAASASAAGGPVFLTAAELSARQPALRSEADAWRELAPVWGIALPEGATDPCSLAQRAQWQCFKSAAGGLPLIRQLDRPGFITLRDDAGRSVHALLVGLDARQATLRLGPNQPPLQATLVSLANLWQGDFATYWRAPDGYSGVIIEGMRGPAVDLLGAQLATARGEPAPGGALTYDAAMRARVQAFQLAHGLRPDGIAGPTTLMQLSRASGGPLQEPRLTTAPSP